MPAPKKRRLFSSPPHTKQGIAASYVLEHFNTVPISLDQIQKGYIFFLWITNKHNVGLVDNKLCTILSRSDSHSLNYSIAKVVKSLSERYKKLTDPKQFERFEKECAESFMEIIGAPKRKAPSSLPTSSPLVSDAVPHPSTLLSPPVSTPPSTSCTFVALSPVKTRRNCKILRKILQKCIAQ